VSQVIHDKQCEGTNDITFTDRDVDFVVGIAGDTFKKTLGLKQRNYLPIIKGGLRV
jgi:hypothetical protein